MQAKKLRTVVPSQNVLSDIACLRQVVLTFLGTKAPARLRCVNKRWHQICPVIPIRLDVAVAEEPLLALAREKLTTGGVSISRLEVWLRDALDWPYQQSASVLQATRDLVLRELESCTFFRLQRAQTPVLQNLRRLELCGCCDSWNVPWHSLSGFLPNLESLEIAFIMNAQRKIAGPSGVGLVDLSRFTKLTNVECGWSDSVELRLPHTLTRLKYNRGARWCDKVFPHLGTLEIVSSESAGTVELDWSRFPILHTLVTSDVVLVAETQATPSGLRHLKASGRPVDLGLFAGLPLRSLSVKWMQFVAGSGSDKLNLEFLEELDVCLLSASDLSIIVPLAGTLKRFSCRELPHGGSLDTNSLSRLPLLSTLCVSGSREPIVVDLAALTQCPALTSIDLDWLVDVTPFDPTLELYTIRNFKLGIVKTWPRLDAFPSLRSFCLTLHDKNADHPEFKRQLHSLKFLERATFCTVPTKEFQGFDLVLELHHLVACVPRDCVVISPLKNLRDRRN